MGRWQGAGPAGRAEVSLSLWPGSAAAHRRMVTLAERSLYDSWTSHLPHDPSHDQRTADAAGLAAVDEHSGWAGPTGPGDFIDGRSGADLPHCRHRRDQPALCL